MILELRDGSLPLRIADPHAVVTNHPPRVPIGGPMAAP